MKLKNLISLRYRTKLIRQFGQASLVKLPNGQPFMRSIFIPENQRTAGEQPRGLLAKNSPVIFPEVAGELFDQSLIGENKSFKILPTGETVFGSGTERKNARMHEEQGVFNFSHDQRLPLVDEF